MPTCSLDVLARIAPVVPAALVARLERNGVPTATSDPLVQARPAASVVLLRDGTHGLETFLLHRHAGMAFAASMVVFPGGRVDPVDDGAAAGVFAACAVRETAEETGVVLAPGDLMPWAHWTTPTYEPRRYDTAFYVAAAPAGQRAADLSTETESAGWSGVADALAAFAAGEIALMPPTLSILTELADLPDLAAVRAAADGRRVVPVLPRVVRTPSGWAFHYPGAP